MIKKIFALIILVISVMILVISCSSGKSTPSTSTVKQETAIAPKEVIDFLSKHPELGDKRKIESMPDWANGTRQKVITTKGIYLFYIQNNEVVGVKQYNTDNVPIIDIYRKN